MSCYELLDGSDLGKKDVMEVALYSEAQTFAWFQKRYESMGLTQSSLARQCGISTADLSRYQHRKQYPRLDVINKLAEALDCNVVELMIGLGVLDADRPPKVRKSRFGGRVDFTK